MSKREIIENEFGNSLTRTIVSLAGEEILVGDAAKNDRSSKPESTISGAKRLLDQPTPKGIIQQNFQSSALEIDQTNGISKSKPGPELNYMLRKKF
jgi:molecular chaperone DnaK (HSP70)